MIYARKSGETLFGSLDRAYSTIEYTESPIGKGRGSSIKKGFKELLEPLMFNFYV
jgi:hypothetical protein